MLSPVTVSPARRTPSTMILPNAQPWIHFWFLLSSVSFFVRRYSVISARAAISS